MTQAIRNRRYIYCALGVFTLLLSSHLYARHEDDRAMATYHSLASPVTYDRTGTIVQIGRNSLDQVCLFTNTYPESVRELVLAKEDQWFAYHPGIHPYRSARALVLHLVGRPTGGASTITQQLAKTLLNTTTERTLTHKVEEFVLALVLEYRHPKDELLTMYLNTVPLGGNIQGFPAAARAYFDKQVVALNQNETLQIVSTLARPESARPLSETNLAHALALASVLDTASPLASTGTGNTPTGVWLELADLQRDCSHCTSTLDLDLTERIRALARAHTDRGRTHNATHAAVVVLAVSTGELLAMVGSPDPNAESEGMRINMALATRPIGSTIKPFLYLRGFEKGLRPYTQVEDREYKFDIETGFPLYPKNYDGAYRGTVTLEEALANSLNVPTVEVLRYGTLRDAYTYFERTLGFAPLQPWERYAYGIALGGLELDLLTLTQAFSALADHGTIKPVVVARRAGGAPQTFLPPHSTVTSAHSIAPQEYVALVNAILTDRAASVEQFGTRGSLHLSRDGYAVKTGTSRDYHDSWTVGYTGDYVVGVWVGNTENKPMDGVSGALGAGALWHDVMELMYTTPYYRGTPLDLKSVVHIPDERGYSYGLPGDDIEVARALLQEQSLILFPHEGDTFLYTEGMRIPLTASQEVEWTLDDAPFTPTRNGWYPTQPGTYTLTATVGERTETIQVEVVEEPERTM